MYVQWESVGEVGRQSMWVKWEGKVCRCNG